MVLPVLAYTRAEEIRCPMEYTCELKQTGCVKIILKQYSEPFSP